MEIFQGNAEHARIATHLIERDEARIPVVGGVLDTLGHGSATQLLHPQRKIVTMIMEPRAQLVKDAGQLGTTLGSCRERVSKISNPFRKVGAVNLESNRHFGKRCARMSNFRNQGCHSPYLGWKQGLHHQTLARHYVISDRSPVPGQPLIEGCEIPLMIMIDEDAVDLAHGVISGSPGNWPRLGQFFSRLKDLLDSYPLLGGKRSQPVQVSERIS